MLENQMTVEDDVLQENKTNIQTDFIYYDCIPIISGPPILNLGWNILFLRDVGICGKKPLRPEKPIKEKKIVLEFKLE